MTLIRQASNQRLLDAYQSEANDFAVVTRPFQGNDSQQWHLHSIGGVGTLQQTSTGRYLDAYETGHDHSAVTRTAQDNDSQRWVLIPTGIGGAYTIQQLSTARYLDAYQTEAADYNVVLREAQYDDDTHQTSSQIWHGTVHSGASFYFKQLSTGASGGPGGPDSRYLDAYQSDDEDFSAVTRLFQGNDTQRWKYESLGGVYRLHQASTGRYMDAYTAVEQDFGVVTREAKAKPWHNAPGQCWVILGDAVRQASSGRYLDAYQTEDGDYRVVTRLSQDNPTQRWTFDQPPPPPPKLDEITSPNPD